MLVATFASNTDWVGRQITKQGGDLFLEDSGPITASEVMAYDSGGYLQWVNDAVHRWVEAKAKSEAGLHLAASDPDRLVDLPLPRRVAPTAHETHREAGPTSPRGGLAQPLQDMTNGWKRVTLAVFNSSTEWEGRRVGFEGSVFVLEGHRPLSASEVAEYDRLGQLDWVTGAVRPWIYLKAGKESGQFAGSASRIARRTRSLAKELASVHAWLVRNAPPIGGMACRMDPKVQMRLLDRSERQDALVQELWRQDDFPALYSSDPAIRTIVDDHFLGHVRSMILMQGLHPDGGVNSSPGP